MAFRIQIPIRFGDVDHAGIVYYPRYFTAFHTALEEFFNTQGLPFVELLDRERIGFPVVHVDADFRRPMRFGDVLDVDVWVEAIGRSSIVFRYRGRKGEKPGAAADAEGTGAVVVEAAIKVVTVNLETLTSIPVPEHVRALLSRNATPPA